MELNEKRIAILGAGHIGKAIADGLVEAGILPRDRLIMTRRSQKAVELLTREGYAATRDNVMAARQSDIVVIAVGPGDICTLLAQIKPVIKPERHLIISVVTGVTVAEIDKVTTPKGITISGLNQMEHHGFSSAMIHGIVVAADKAARLFHGEKSC